MGLRIYTDAKPLTAAQQQLVMQYYKLTKGRGCKFSYGTKKPGKAKKLADFKLQMVAAKVPNELIYGF